ncbi:hypothetical protein GF337_12890, partial [candidate division KSB1 bacterium]|nr:hypothetical protein [candidate division KSB1 bacterium]
EILDLLKNASSKSDRTRLERTLVAVAAKFQEKESPSEVILSEITDIKDSETKSSLIKVLGVIGEPQALPVLQTYLTDEDAGIRIAAIYAMSDYPTPEPLDDLFEIARSSTDEVHRILALRGYIRLLGLESDRPQDTTVELYLNAMELAENIQEKRMVLSGLSKVYTIRSFETVVTYLDDSALRPEAEVAALELAKKVGWRDPVKTKAVLRDLIDSTENEQLKIEARELVIKMSR